MHRLVVAVALILSLSSGANQALAQSEAEHALERAVEAVSAQDYLEAVRLLTVLIDDPSLPEPLRETAFLNRGAALLGAGDYDGAVRDSTKVIESDPGSAAARVNRASALENRGETAAALVDLARAIELKPDGYLPYYNRGRLFFRHGKLDEAERDLRRAASLEQHDSAADILLAQLLAQTDRSGEALAVLDRALAKQPDVYLFFTHGSVAHQAGDTKQAVADYTKAIELRAWFGEAYYNRALILAEAGEFVSALADAEKAIANGIDARPMRSALRFTLGDLRGALEDADQVIASRSAPSRILKDRGSILLMLGRVPEALVDLERYVSTAPDDAYGHIFLFVARARAGQDGRDALRGSPMAQAPEWPGQVIRFLLGSQTAEHLLETARAGEALSMASQVCEAHYYIGQADLAGGRREAAAEHFRACSSVPLPRLTEYRAAAEELHRLEAPHAAAQRD